MNIGIELQSAQLLKYRGKNNKFVYLSRILFTYIQFCASIPSVLSSFNDFHFYRLNQACASFISKNNVYHLFAEAKKKQFHVYCNQMCFRCKCMFSPFFMTHHYVCICFCGTMYMM